MSNDTSTELSKKPSAARRVMPDRVVSTSSSNPPPPTTTTTDAVRSKAQQQLPANNATTTARTTTTSAPSRPQTRVLRSDRPLEWLDEYQRTLPRILNNTNSNNNATRRTYAAARSAVAQGDFLRILRVNQLDAEKLNTEINDILRAQFLRIFSFFEPYIIERIQPELTALLQILIYRFSVFGNDQSYGDKLQNLKYVTYSKENTNSRSSSRRHPFRSSMMVSPSTTRKIIHGTLSIGGRWLWVRLNRLSADRGWGDEPAGSWKKVCWETLSRVEIVYQLLNIINFLVFLYNGKYRSLVDRLLRMRLVYERPLMARQVSFEYMNRQLVWSGFAEMLLFLIPLINLEKMKRLLLGRMQRQVLLDESALPLSACPICELNPVQVPYITNCGHMYCYYCLKTALMTDSDFHCHRCGQKVTAMARQEFDPRKEAVLTKQHHTKNQQHQDTVT